MEEYVDVLDEKGDPTGERKLKSDAHRAGDRHKVVHVWIINPRGELLVQRRAPTKENHPNLWDISYAGHISAGETSLRTALREGKEELGLNIKEGDLEYLFITDSPRLLLNGGAYIDHEFQDTYLLRVKDDVLDLKLQTEEVAETKWVPWEVLEVNIQKEPDLFVPHAEEYRKLFAKLRREKNEKGFALFEVVLVVALLALAAGGGFYFMNMRGGNVTPASGTAAVQQAQNVAAQVASATAPEQNVIDQVSGAGTSAPVAAPAPVPQKPSPATQAASDPLAGLGSNIYANGNLPLGDGKYVTSGPKKGYVYVCNANVNGQGAESNGPWIGASTWNTDQKISVAGSVTWPNASYAMNMSGGTRTITTNDLPGGGITTGIFPIGANDPAHAYDTNPNSVKAQSLSFSFPASPTAAATPSCIGGEVGVMTDGVMLFDAFDAELRDAPAHELQDSCDGHPQEAGEYHYHGPSVCLPNGSTTVIGFAFDGFPITGAKIAASRYLTTSDLDECHGITSPIVLDGKTVSMYHYVMTEDFPYSISCFRGTSTVKGPTAPPSGGGQGQPQGGPPPGQSPRGAPGGY